MKLVSPPQATANRSTPPNPDSSSGIVLVVSRKAPGGSAQIDGVFQVPLDDADAIGRPRHRALVCAVWSAGGYQDSVVPFRDVVLFPDDEIRQGNLLWGAFRFEIDPYPGDGYYLHLALGNYLSPSLCWPAMLARARPPGRDEIDRTVPSLLALLRPVAQFPASPFRRLRPPWADSKGAVRSPRGYGRPLWPDRAWRRLWR
jgi:hypothetical protein